MARPQRPNILYILSDQQWAGALTCAGNPDLHTPAMDSLARTGVQFAHAYCSFPLCGPARASMFTGRMPHELGVADNGQPIPEAAALQGLGHLLARGGYECVYGGKWHVPEMSLPQENEHGFRTICGLDDGRLAQRCTEFLKGRHGKPFFLVASFDNPHNICEWGREQEPPWGAIPAPAALPECPNLPANHAIPPFEPAAIRLFQRSAAFLSYVTGFSHDDWRRYRYAYYRLVEKVDREIGRILDALREAGLDEDTVVIFSSDHGECNGAHGLIQKFILYEEAVRVPLIISHQGSTREGSVDTAHLVSNGLDLVPTVCDYAGVEVPPGLEGRSLRPLVEGREAPWRDHLVVETHFGGDAQWQVRGNGRMVRTARLKYVVYDRFPHREQLFDMERDPGEMVNLAVEARHQAVLDAHRALLRAWCARTGDRFGRHYARGEVPFTIPGHGHPEE